jgi:DNA-binding GntR family transcriptional regulator
MTRTATRANDRKSLSPFKASPQNAEISLTQQAYERLQEMLVTMQLKPGMMISENQMADYLSLGRTPVREAVQQLQREGLLEVHRARGIMVAPINAIRQLQLLDVRRGLEQLVAKRASRQATESQRTAMIALANRITESATADDAIEFIRTNRLIHAIKVEATGNEILKNVMGLFYGLSMRFWYANHERQPKALLEAGNLHSEILKAIATSNEKTAADLTDTLMDFLEAFTRRTIDQNLSYDHHDSTGKS